MTSRRFWELTWTLAVTDWRLRFYGSALGYLWTLARPFAFFGVIYIVFTEVADFGNQVKDYGICILFRVVPVGFNSLCLRERSFHHLLGSSAARVFRSY